MLFDSHAHINFEDYTEEDRNQLIKEIEASDLAYVMDVGFDLISSIQAVKDAGALEGCFAAIGFHPYDAVKKMTEEDICRLETLYIRNKDKVKAIGEIGLDYHYDDTDRELQKLWFRRQIQLANKLKLPIVVHSRDADQDTLDILKEEGAFSKERCGWFPQRRGANCVMENDARVLLHCFSGSREMGQQYVKLGATLSVAGPLTFKNNRKTTEMVSGIPMEYLLVETDSPYLTPEPFRGKPNKPYFVEHTARRLAVIKGVSYETACSQTMENAKVFFDIIE